MPDQIKRQKSFPACGRLIVLESVQGVDFLTALRDPNNYSRFVSINFPSMPDGIDLARRANYTVSSPPGYPDGIHLYQGTSPLEIPFSFKLHAFDSEFCPNGSKTLLQVAADLESLVLPFGPDAMSVRYDIPQAKGDQVAGDNGSVLANAANPTIGITRTPAGIYPPATCFLELIRTEDDSVGLACVGYVKEVRVRLLGPFMKGPGSSQNLPTNGEFEFVFVHHPGHTNRSFASVSVVEQQASANIVQKRLYNTVSLLTRQEDFVGFDSSTSNSNGSTGNGS